LPEFLLGRRAASGPCGEVVFADDLAGERCLWADEAAPGRDFSYSDPDWDACKLELGGCSGGVARLVLVGPIISGGSNIVGLS
jgi:hypothetical protein